MPAVGVARDGFRGKSTDCSRGPRRYVLTSCEVNEDLVRYMKSATASDNFLVNDPTWAIDFAPNGRTPFKNITYHYTNKRNHRDFA